MNIAFFSSSDFTLPILESIRDSQNKPFWQVLKLQLDELDIDWKSTLPDNFEELIMGLRQDCSTPINLQTVVSQPDREYRKKIIVNPIANFAKKNSIPTWTPHNLNKELTNQLDEVDLLLTASYGQFVGSRALNKPNLGCLNWHPSLLPKYRGATPLQSSLLVGDNQVGLSWIDMTKKMDEGRVYWQISKAVVDSDNFNNLINYFGLFGQRTWAIAIACKLLNLGFNQNNSLATDCNKFDKEYKLINPKILQASDIFRHYRALIDFPGTSFADQYFGCEVKILECRVVKNDFKKEEFSIQKHDNWLVLKDSKKQLVLLECGNNSLLEVSKICLSTGKVIDFRGYQFLS